VGQREWISVCARGKRRATLLKPLQEAYRTFVSEDTAKPWIMDHRIACGRCSAHCPPEAIKMMNKTKSNKKIEFYAIYTSILQY
jgi:formate hydrogenlyase subunit 6/NADH:ubiquinone oxidoreductase subunit I